jgi:protocatechuate 3,4-dioxygenase beta subunit
VLHEGAPVSGARVNVFAPVQKSLAGCKGKSPTDLLGQCLCPSEREAFTSRAIAGLESTPPVASTTTAADGSFTLSVEGAGPFVTRVSSADGALAATISNGAEAREIALQPAKTMRFKLSGVTAGAAAYLLDWSTGEVVRLAAREGEWVSPPLPRGTPTLVVVAPGAVPSRQSIVDGHLAGMPGMREEVPTVTLSAPHTLRGVVTDLGTPLAGVEVVGDPETCAISTKTNASGEFSLPSPNNRPYLTVITARGRGKVATGFASVDRPAELALKPAARLELTFVDPKGAPVPGLDVWVSGQDGSIRQHPPSDAQGRWTLDDLVDGTLQLRVNGAWVLMSDPNLQLKGVTKLRPVVARGVTLSGRVLDAKGKPVPGVDVSPFFGDQLQTQVTDAMKEVLRSQGHATDGQGAFELTALIPGDYEVLAKSPSFGEGTAMGTAPGRVEITLVAPFFLEGDVVDSAGKPVDKAWLSFHRKDEPNHQFSVTTGPDGHFRYALKAPGTFEVTAARGGTTGSAPGKPQLAEIPGGRLKFVVADQQSIRGTVVDASGSPRAGVLVQAIPVTMPMLVMARMQRRPVDPVPLVMQAKMMRMYAEATSDKDGTFAIALGSEALVFAEGEGGLSAEPVSASPAAPLRLVLASRARATGRVLDWNGKPVEAFSVDGKQFTSPEGRFEVTLPGKGSVSLRIDGALAPYETRTVQVPETPTEVALGDIKLKRGFTVSGKVLSAVTGQPLDPSPYLDAKSEGGQVDAAAIQRDGTFSLKRVPEGKLTVTASREKYTSAGVTVAVKPGVGEVVLKLEKTASLEITILRGGEPASEVDVEASGPPTPTTADNRRLHTTASDGKVKLEQLSAGSWTVKAGREKPTTRTVKLKPGEEAKLELTVP